jgi:hypothetical protein
MWSHGEDPAAAAQTTSIRTNSPTKPTSSTPLGSGVGSNVVLRGVPGKHSERSWSRDPFRKGFVMKLSIIYCLYLIANIDGAVNSLPITRSQ